jgi:hypothetical protein
MDTARDSMTLAEAHFRRAARVAQFVTSLAGMKNLSSHGAPPSRSGGGPQARV